MAGMSNEEFYGMILEDYDLLLLEMQEALMGVST